MTITASSPASAPQTPSGRPHERSQTGPSEPPGRFTRSNQVGAWLVHLYTASGALLAFFGTIAVFEARYRDSLLCMMAATWIDATDGLLARRARVSDVLDRFDGSRLDDIVDYLTFVFLPALFVFHSAMLPYGWDWVV